MHESLEASDHTAREHHEGFTFSIENRYTCDGNALTSLIEDHKNLSVSGAKVKCKGCTASGYAVGRSARCYRRCGNHTRCDLDSASPYREGDSVRLVGCADGGSCRGIRSREEL